MKVIYTTIYKSLDIMDEFDVKIIFFGIDQAIYTKVLDVMLKMEEKDLKYSRKLSHVWVLAWYLHATGNLRTV